MRETRGFSMAAKGGTGEIYIYDMIGADMFGEGVTATWLRDELKKLGDVKTLKIYLNSPGGNVFDGAAIHSQLLRHPARKIVHVDGEAASAASLILMAGDERRIAAGGVIMVHRPYGLSLGTADDMRHYAKTLDILEGQYADEYARGTRQKREKIVALMAEEKWMGSAEALALGFVHAIDAPMQMAACAVRAEFDRSKLGYRKPVPAAFQPSQATGFPEYDACAALVRRQASMLAARRAAA